VQEFVSLGADIYARDVNGDTVLHIAASRGIAWLLVYFHLQLKMDANDRNARGRTPLHIAALEHQEQIAWLLSNWTSDIDARDGENMTPLHFAALANNYRIVRHLLMSGASRMVEDDQGMTPSDIAMLVRAFDLVKVLNEPSCLAKINPIKAPIKPIKQSKLLFVFFHILFALRYLLVFFFVLPGLSEEFLFTSCFLMAVNSLLYLWVSNKNPGYVESVPDHDLLYLYSIYNMESVCPSCETKRHSSTRHCQHCGKCVKKFDHHCPWINNCVGAGNHRLFTVFIVMLLLDFVYHCALGALDYAEMLPESNVVYHDFFKSTAIVRSRRNIGLAVAILCGICSFPVTSLCLVQIGNLLTGKTTHQRFAHKKATENEPLNTKVTEELPFRVTSSDTSSILIPPNENDFAFFSGTTLTAGALSRDRIKISLRPRCFGLCVNREVTMEDSQDLMLATT